jgi:Myb-like DNA-binding domain
MHSGAVGAPVDFNAMMHVSTMTPLQLAQQQQQQQPIVTMQMLQCVLCTSPFSLSGKLSDHRTPVFAVNPSASIEGPYCISCAGKREGLRSFQIDDARVTLVKLMHHHMAQSQSQQLSTGAAYAYAALHHHHHNHNPAVSNINNNNHHLQQQQQKQQQQTARRDAPGLTIAAGALAPATDTANNSKRLFSNHPGNPNRSTTSTSTSTSSGSVDVLATGSNKRSKNASNNNPCVKSTWTEKEDSFLVHAVTTSTDQPFTRWSDLSAQLPGRIGKQIRDRWLNHLDPKIDRSPFSRDEDVKLFQAYKVHGKRWVEISTKYFDSKRSENHIKNRWYSAAFKKFVKSELGEDPFHNNNNNSAPTLVADATSLAQEKQPCIKKCRPPTAVKEEEEEDASEAGEEKKEES